MENGEKKKRTDLLFPEMSYKIVGVLFEVSNELGPGLQEKYYQRALAVLFKKYNVNFREQVPVSINCSGTNIGRYFLDFLIEDKIILEIKKGDIFRRSNIQQVVGYLKSLQKQLGILASFTSKGVIHKRILNIQK